MFWDFEGEGGPYCLFLDSCCFPNSEVKSCALKDDRVEPFLSFFYWSDDCSEPSLVSIWQSNVPYTQVVKVLENMMMIITMPTTMMMMVMIMMMISALSSLQRSVQVPSHLLPFARKGEGLLRCDSDCQLIFVDW